jgi:predicted phage terminase large subunit-like protein
VSLPFKLIAFSAIAQEDEEHVYRDAFGWRVHRRFAGEALHPAREPIEVLDLQRRLLGTQHFSAQYLQMPAPPGGNLIKIDHLARFDRTAPPEFDYVIQSWDTAHRSTARADYSVCATFGAKGKHVYLIDILRRRVEYPELKRLVRQQQALFTASVILVEDCASGIALIQELRSENMAGLREHKPLKDKVVRMEIHTAMIEAGLMHVPYSAPWLDDYLQELMMFPNGKHDDQVDATSQALAHLFARVGPDAWLQEAREWKAREQEKDIPVIRVNHLDPGRQFHLISGRIPVRAADGAFLVTPEELKALRAVPGMIIPEASSGSET